MGRFWWSVGVVVDMQEEGAAESLMHIPISYIIIFLFCYKFKNSGTIIFFLIEAHMKFHDTPYDVYVKNFGKVRSGTKLTNSDYMQPGISGSIPYDEDRKIAVTLACDDIINKNPMKTKSDFEKELQRLKS